MTLVNDNFKHLEDICRTHDFYPVDGILLDLGISSLQLDDRDRGFSFRFDAPLDMRFGTDQSTTAAKILNSFTERDIADLLKDYGEERHSRLIARRIVAIRPITTTMQLVNAIERLPGMTSGRIHPATRTFQALRIAVNREMENLEEVLKPDGTRSGQRRQIGGDQLSLARGSLGQAFHAGGVQGLPVSTRGAGVHLRSHSHSETRQPEGHYAHRKRRQERTPAAGAPSSG